MNTTEELKEEYIKQFGEGFYRPEEIADWWLAKLEAQKQQAYQEGVEAELFRERENLDKVIAQQIDKAKAQLLRAVKLDRVKLWGNESLDSMAKINRAEGYNQAVDDLEALKSKFKLNK